MAFLQVKAKVNSSQVITGYHADSLRVKANMPLVKVSR